MRIQFVINTMGRGGAEIQVRDLASRLRERGHEVAMLVMLPYEEFEPELAAAGVHTESLAMSRGAPTMGALVGAIKALRRFKPDVVHSHLWGANVLARLAVPLAFPLGWRPPLVCTAHAGREQSPLRYVAYRATAPACDLFTFVSEDARLRHRDHGAIGRCEAICIPNGIDIERFVARPEARASIRAELGIGEDAFLWLSVGSFRAEEKDYGTLLRAFSRVHEKEPGARLAIAGEGRLLEEKRALARELGLGGSVSFLGLRNDVAELFRACDAFVLSSVTEALPVVLLEAAATRLPIVSTRVGDVPSVVLPGKTGSLVPPSSPRELADAMLEVMRLPTAVRAAMGERARAHVSEVFALEPVVDTWIATYRRLIAARRTSHGPHATKSRHERPA